MKKTPKNPKTKRSANVDKTKNFVIDTNVLIQDAHALVNFAEHNVYVPHEVIEELDGFKKGDDDRSYQARETFRLIDQKFPNASTLNGGYRKPAGGLVRFIGPDAAALAKVALKFPDVNKSDNRILASALTLKLQGKAVIVVSRDGGVRTKARILGMEAEDLERDKVHEDDVKKQEVRLTFPATDHQIQCMQSTGELQVEPALTERLDKIFAAYLMLDNTDKPGKMIPARYLGVGKFRKLKYAGDIHIHGGRTLSPKNVEQAYLFDALHDPTIKLITVTGKAGTGKTLAAIAAGLEQVEDGTYDKLLVGRAIMPMGNDVGFYPGDKFEKMLPWARPLIDNLEFLLSPRHQANAKPAQFENKVQSDRKQSKRPPQGQQPGFVKPMRPHELLIAQGKLDLEVLAHIRGASISNAFFVVDEMQNTTRHEAKTVVTRMGANAKLVLTGDPNQIDCQYVDSLSNGLVHTMVSMRGDPEHVHINLIKGERSRLAESAAKRM
jgi:PhoH-like ATPase